MNFVILDLEWNSSYSKRSKGFISEIIEFGAVRFDDSFNIIGTFSMLVSPQVGKKLSGKVKELTNISNEELAADGNTYTHVFSKFRKFLSPDDILMTWGTCDILAIMENNEYYNKTDDIGFIGKYVDIQRYCAEMLGIYNAGQQLGLLPAAEQVGIDLTDVVLHRALQDARMSMDIFARLYNKEKLEEFIETGSELHYRLTFKPYYLTDMNHPLVNKGEFNFVCDKCGRPMSIKENWVLRNRGFVAVLYCEKCSRTMTGKVRFKINYNGMSIKKRLVPCEDSEENTENTETAEEQSV